MGNSVALHGFGGGGASLNYKVVRYASEADLPETAQENTIAFFSDVEMSSHIFSPVEPEASEAGMLWVQTGSASPAAFNALKKNSIVICPLSAKQYIDSTWVSVTAKSYIGGEWVEWIRYLLTADGFASELGAMTAYGESGKSISITPLTSGGVLIERTGSGTSYVALCSEDTIDVSEFDTMRIKTGAVVSNYVNAGLSTINDSASVAYTKVVSSTLTANSEILIDVSDLSGNYYLAFGMDYYDVAMSAELLEITLE